jgi:hypothetical protein
VQQRGMVACDDDNNGIEMSLSSSDIKGNDTRGSNMVGWNDIHGSQKDGIGGTVAYNDRKHDYSTMGMPVRGMVSYDDNRIVVSSLSSDRGIVPYSGKGWKSAWNGSNVR